MKAMHSALTGSICAAMPPLASAFFPAPYQPALTALPPALRFASGQAASLLHKKLGAAIGSSVLPHAGAKANHLGAAFRSLRRPLARRFRAWQGNSPHPQPVALAAAACIRTQLHPRSSLQALHTSPKGLRYRCSASLFLLRQQPAYTAGCISVQQVCLRIQLLAAQHCQAMHSSPKGLRCRCSASLLVSRQQAAFAAGCSRCSKPAFAASCILLIPASDAHQP